MNTLLPLAQLVVQSLGGYKTALAALLAVFVAVNAQYRFVDEQTQQTLLAAAAALGLWGLGSQQSDTKKAVENGNGP